METEHLIPTSQLKTNLLRQRAEQKQPIVVDYDKEFDAFVIRVVPLEVKAVAHYIDEHVALLYEADTLEVIGLQIEDFALSFLPAHASVRKVWKLSHAGVELKDFGDMIFEIERMKPKVAREIVKATQSQLGEAGVGLEAALA